MVNAVLYIASFLIHYSAKVEHVKSFGPTRPVITCSEGWATLKAKNIVRTDSTITEYFPGKTIVYKLKAK